MDFKYELHSSLKEVHPAPNTFIILYPWREISAPILFQSEKYSDLSNINDSITLKGKDYLC
jgi:hypothetical protein